MTPPQRRPGWDCLVELDEETHEICPAWGYADELQSAGEQQHAHYLEHHYQPPEDVHDDPGDR